MSENKTAINDAEKSEIVASFLGQLLEEMKERNLPSSMQITVATKAISMCAAALADLKRFPKELSEDEAKVFVEAYALGSMYQQ